MNCGICISYCYWDKWMNLRQSTYLGVWNHYGSTINLCCSIIEVLSCLPLLEFNLHTYNQNKWCIKKKGEEKTTEIAGAMQIHSLPYVCIPYTALGGHSWPLILAFSYLFTLLSIFCCAHSNTSFWNLRYNTKHISHFIWDSSKILKGNNLTLEKNGIALISGGPHNTILWVLKDNFGPKCVCPALTVGGNDVVDLSHIRLGVEIMILVQM